MSQSSPHHVNGFRVFAKAEGIAAGCCAKVNGHHHIELRGSYPPAHAPLKKKSNQLTLLEDFFKSIFTIALKICLAVRAATRIYEVVGAVTVFRKLQWISL